MYNLLPFFFFSYGFEFQVSVCNACHDLTMFCFTVKGVGHRFIIYHISKSEVIHLLENSVLEDRGYI